MGIYYKQDIDKLLYDAGYTSYNLNEKGILNNATWMKLKKHKLVSWETLDKICTLLQMQPGDIIDYEEDE